MGDFCFDYIPGKTRWQARVGRRRDRFTHALDHSVMLFFIEAHVDWAVIMYRYGP